MQFMEFHYERPDIDEFEERISILLGSFQKTKLISQQIEIIDEVNSRRNHILTMVTIAQIRNLLNINEQKYLDEMKYINQKWGLYEVVVAKYYDFIIQSPFKEQLKQKYGNQLFSIAEHNIKTVSKKVLKEIEIENNLQSEYTRIIAGARIDFQGKVRNLSELDRFISSSDRDVRKEASIKKYELMSEIEDEIDSIFDSLIKVRTKIAEKLGYQSFVELGYSRLSRVDYNKEDVSNFRKLILEKIVPLSVELRNRQRKRLELGVLEHFDEDVRFKSESFNPKGDADWIISKFKKIFNEISTQAGKEFNLMDEKNLLN
jgi:M3 family oligoendopeptidase